MNRGWKIVGVLLGIIIIISVVVPVTIHFLKPDDDVSEPMPIIILSDFDFTKYNLLGTGSKNDPYIIENYKIETSNDYAIHISFTTKYFVIRNCILEANSFGILIDHVAYGTAKIINNTCNNQGMGITLFGSNGLLLENNICNGNNFTGIHVVGSDILLENNTCNDNENDGINLGSYTGFSSNITLSNNTCFRNYNGISTIFLANSSFTDNNCNFNDFVGITSVDSSGVNISNSNCSYNQEGGIDVDHTNDNFTLISNYCNKNYFGVNVESSNSFVSNNTCNFNTYGIVLQSTNINITNNFCSENKRGMVLAVANGHLYNNQFFNNTYVGLDLFHSPNTIVEQNVFQLCGIEFWASYDFTEHSTLTMKDNWVNDKKVAYFYSNSSLIIDESDYGQIILVNCTNILISNQEMSHASQGIVIEGCKNITLINNYCSYLKYGIYCINSTEIQLINNTCLDDGEGIILDRCTIVTITNNTSINNTYGIFIYVCLNITVQNCTINWNFRGVFLSSSEYCLFIFNLFKENEDYAFRDYGALVNILYYNDFIDNNSEENSQAYDHLGPNIWYNTTTNEGNYWSDWTGSGPYYIDGDALATDPYPLANPVNI